MREKPKEEKKKKKVKGKRQREKQLKGVDVPRHLNVASAAAVWEAQQHSGSRPLAMSNVVGSMAASP